MLIDLTEQELKALRIILNTSIPDMESDKKKDPDYVDQPLLEGLLGVSRKLPLPTNEDP